MLTSELSYTQLNDLIFQSCQQAIIQSDCSDKDEFLAIFNSLHFKVSNLKSFISENIGKNDDHVRKIVRLKFIKSTLVDMVFCLKNTREYSERQATFDLVETTPVKTISIGINGMATEYIDHNITIKLQGLLNLIEEIDSLGPLTKFITDILTEDEGILPRYTNIDTQLFYADIIYGNFESIYKGIFKTGKSVNLSENQIPLLNLYTWVGGDQDGIPFTTAENTAAVLSAFFTRIKQNYRNDFQLLLKKYDDSQLQLAAGLLESSIDPREITSILDQYDYVGYPDIYFLNMKLKSFGFHYMELEFRENSRVIHEAVNEIISSDVVFESLSINKTYSDLDEDEKESLLTKLISTGLAKTIIDNFNVDNHDYFVENEKAHEGETIYDLHENNYDYLKKYNAKRFLKWFSFFNMYPSMCNKFGVAEAKSKVDALAVLFCAKGIVSNNIHIVLQPEGPAGAFSLYNTVSDLYQNEVYSHHLQLIGNKQYITFGPSDIGKQGGKGMHFTNMQLANMHRLIAVTLPANTGPSSH